MGFFLCPDSSLMSQRRSLWYRRPWEPADNFVSMIARGYLQPPFNLDSLQVLHTSFKSRRPLQLHLSINRMEADPRINLLQSWHSAITRRRLKVSQARTSLCAFLGC